MEKITINPGKVMVEGNIISNRHGYLQSADDFQAHKCKVSLNNPIGDGWKGFDIYSLRLTADNTLINKFNDDIAYCSEDSLSSLFVCEHFTDIDNPATIIFDVTRFTDGYRLTVKDEYLEDNKDLTSHFFLVILQDNQGVEIPVNAQSITYSCFYDASSDISSIMVGFVYFDKNGKLISNQEIGDIANAGTGNIGRCNITSYDIPANAKYVGVEFQFPDGVDKHYLDAGFWENDYFQIQLNCLLFNNTYGGFVRNE